MPLLATRYGTVSIGRYCRNPDRKWYLLRRSDNVNKERMKGGALSLLKVGQDDAGVSKGFMESVSFPELGKTLRSPGCLIIIFPIFMPPSLARCPLIKVLSLKTAGSSYGHRCYPRI